MSQSQAMQLLTSHASEDWYTPPRYVELARQVLGAIDLDPASNPTAQRWIQATTWYSVEQNGLLQDWAGRVWLNPPYGKTNGRSGDSCQALWSARLARDYQAGRVSAAVLLINSTHGYGWYEDLWTRWPVCCARERIRFLRPDGSQGGQAKRGQTFVYFGPDVARFVAVFGPIGRVILPESEAA